MNLCGDDINALAETIVANLDAAQAKGQRALVIMHQGISLPDAWLAQCETYALDSGNFTGDICLPWDPSYKANLGAALNDVIGPAVADHAALDGVYFTTTTMTNGAEFHFRVDKADFPYPGDEIFRSSYLDIMDLYQAAFSVPILFEAGHCPWLGEPDCTVLSDLYEYSRDVYGVGWTGIALWNCAERFWAGAELNAEGIGTKAVIEQAGIDGVSIGCQTVGSFSRGACRFTDDDVGDYGTRVGLMGDVCPDDPDFDPEGACVDTMRWFAGVEAQADETAHFVGTWAENWSADHMNTGVYQTDEDCRAAIDLLAP